MRKLFRLEEARTVICRAIQCKEGFGHAATPWTAWNTLADIETDAGNRSQAEEARRKARASFLAFRRNGGENQTNSGQLVQTILQGLAAGRASEMASCLDQLAADPQTANILPLLKALMIITSGSRDPILAEDPALDYTQAAEVLLLIEALEGCERG